MSFTNIIYGRKDKGGHNRAGSKSDVKSSGTHCCCCFTTIGHGEKKTKIKNGDAHDDCLRRIILKALKCDTKMPGLQTLESPQRILEEGLATIFWNFELDTQFDEKKLSQLRKLHEDFFGTPIQSYRLSVTRRVTKAIFCRLPGESKNGFRIRADEDLQLVEERWEKIFGQELTLSILNESMMQ